MSTATVFAPTSSCRAADELVVLARRASPTARALCMAVLEVWLPIPIRPLLEGYLCYVVSRISSITASVFHTPSH